MQRKLLPGRPYPLGAKANPRGTNFAVYSEHATQVEVCLFDDAGRQTDCIRLRERTAFVWHGLVLGVRPGQLYGLRVDGPWEPEKGERFNKNKLLVDPYTEAISGEVDWKAPIFPYDVPSGDDLKRAASWTMPPAFPRALWWSTASTGAMTARRRRRWQTR